MAPPAGNSSPAISRNSEVLPDPFAPVTASTEPEEASKSSPAKTSRPPRTHLTPRPESRILPTRQSAMRSSSRFGFLFGHDLFGKPLDTFPDHALALSKTVGSAREFCGGAPPPSLAGVAARLESFYKPGNLMPHTTHACKPSRQTRPPVFKYPNRV